MSKSRAKVAKLISCFLMFGNLGATHLNSYAMENSVVSGETENWQKALDVARQCYGKDKTIIAMSGDSGSLFSTVLRKWEIWDCEGLYQDKGIIVNDKGKPVLFGCDKQESYFKAWEQQVEKGGSRREFGKKVDFINVVAFLTPGSWLSKQLPVYKSPSQSEEKPQTVIELVNSSDETETEQNSITSDVAPELIKAWGLTKECLRTDRIAVVPVEKLGGCWTWGTHEPLYRTPEGFVVKEDGTLYYLKDQVNEYQNTCHNQANKYYSGPGRGYERHGISGGTICVIPYISKGSKEGSKIKMLPLLEKYNLSDLHVETTTPNVEHFLSQKWVNEFYNVKDKNGKTVGELREGSPVLLPMIEDLKLKMAKQRRMRDYCNKLRHSMDDQIRTEIARFDKLLNLIQGQPGGNKEENNNESVVVLNASQSGDKPVVETKQGETGETVVLNDADSSDAPAAATVIANDGQNKTEGEIDSLRSAATNPAEAQNGNGAEEQQTTSKSYKKRANSYDPIVNKKTFVVTPKSSVVQDIIKGMSFLGVAGATGIGVRYGVKGAKNLLKRKSQPLKYVNGYGQEIPQNMLLNSMRNN